MNPAVEIKSKIIAEGFVTKTLPMTHEGMDETKIVKRIDDPIDLIDVKDDLFLDREWFKG